MFIDEADTVFPSRSLGNEGDSFGKDMVNQFLQEIDGAKTGTQKIFIRAATNRIEVVDSAIRSRLSQQVEVSLPLPDVRQLIFDDNIADDSLGYTIKGKSFEEYFRSHTEGMSGRDISNLAKKIRNKHGKNKY